MSAITATKVRPEVSTRSGAISWLFHAGWAGVARYFDRRAAMASLGELDDCALRDVGLARSQIEAAAYGFIAPMARPAVTSSHADERRLAPARSPWLRDAPGDLSNPRKDNSRFCNIPVPSGRDQVRGAAGSASGTETKMNTAEANGSSVAIMEAAPWN
jgi:uncharacterized protein YjiS (DUF1127 family)